MSMQEFDISRSQQQELQQDFDADLREQYQGGPREVSRYEPYSSLLDAPYCVEEKIQPERTSEYGSNTTTNKAGFWPALILIAALGLMGLGGLLGYGFSHSNQFVSPAEPIPPVHRYYVHPRFDQRFDGPYYYYNGNSR